MELLDVVQHIIVPLVGLLLLVFNLYLNSKFKTMDEHIKSQSKRLSKVEDNQTAMKDNYVDRFDELKDMLHKIDTKLVAVDVKVTSQKDFCEKVQRAKEIKK